jgi:glyoxylase-like metal-dependent hydrolase (beta-lactamase superfamily II)
MEIAGQEQREAHPAGDEDQNTPLKPAAELLHGLADARDGWSVAILVHGTPTRGSSVLARRGREVVIVDTGLAHHGGVLLAALASHGLQPDEVSLVFNTHAHVDHSHNNVLFPKARVFCSARDREWTLRLYRTLTADPPPAPQDLLAFYPELLDLGYSDKLIRKVLAIERSLWDERRWGSPERTVWLEDTALPDGLTLMSTPGHTPDHVSLLIHTSGEPVLVCGDALLRRDESTSALVLIPPWSSRAYRASRDRILQFRGIVVPGHDDPFRTGSGADDASGQG